MVPQRFFRCSRTSVCPPCNAAIARAGTSFPVLRKFGESGCATRLRHGISPECPSSRHIFLKYTAGAKNILRFELSHKSSSNLFQISADFIDKKRRLHYVLEHRMRAACVLFRSYTDASHLASAPARGSVSCTISKTSPPCVWRTPVVKRLQGKRIRPSAECDLISPRRI